MTSPLPQLTQFRIEPQANGLVHLVFDCPGRKMNVFSNKAIHELGQFARWLQASDARGVVLRSGKDTAFCAGADLTELGVAYDMIMAAPAPDRFDLAYNHFWPLSHAVRRLETAGKPVAAALGGMALGGGCELPLGAHYRVFADSKRALMGLPECGVGLLPGAGGTQRMPRLIGLELGLEVLLDGRNLSGEEALRAGLADAIVPEGEEVAAAEAWLLSDRAHAVQPWDRPDAPVLAHGDYGAAIEARRQRELSRMLGHEPAPLAILDCVELGLMQPMDGAIRSELSVFAALIQRREARNTIRIMFLGKQAYEKAARDNKVPTTVIEAAARAKALVAEAVAAAPVLARAGLPGAGARLAPVQRRPGAGLWFEGEPEAQAAMTALGASLAPLLAPLGEAETLQADHLVAREGTLPAFLGGISGLAALAG